MGDWKKKNSYGLKRCNSLHHPWWLTIVSLPGMGQPWKIMTLSSIQWLSIEQKRYIFGCEKTNKKGWRHHATSPFLVYKISNSKPILLKNSQPHRVPRTWIRSVNESNISYKPNTIGPSGWLLETHCVSSRSGCLKKGREVNRSHHEMTIWGEKWNMF